MTDFVFFVIFEFFLAYLASRGLHRILSDVLVQKIPEKTMTTAINFDKIFALANNAARVKILENFKLLWNRINVIFSVF